MGIKEAAVQINKLHVQMAREIEPMVKHIIRSGSLDAHEIERVLDHLLDCACVSQGLKLFKDLCRYYFAQNPAAVARYVNAYRDLWDEDAEVRK